MKQPIDRRDSRITDVKVPAAGKMCIRYRAPTVYRCCEMTSNAGKATTMDGYPVPSFPKCYVLERQWREVAQYDCGDDHPNNVVDHAHEGYLCTDPVLQASCEVLGNVQPALTKMNPRRPN